MVRNSVVVLKISGVYAEVKLSWIEYMPVLHLRNRGYREFFKRARGYTAYTSVYPPLHHWLEKNVSKV